MKKHSVVIYTDHALTKSTHDQFEYCDVRDDAVCRLGEKKPYPLQTRILVLMVIMALAKAGRIYDKGYWLITFTPGYKVEMNATPLYTLI